MAEGAAVVRMTIRALAVEDRERWLPVVQRVLPPEPSSRFKLAKVAAVDPELLARGPLTAKRARMARAASWALSRVRVVQAAKAQEAAPALRALPALQAPVAAAGEVASEAPVAEVAEAGVAPVPPAPVVPAEVAGREHQTRSPAPHRPMQLGVAAERRGRLVTDRRPLLRRAAAAGVPALRRPARLWVAMAAPASSSSATPPQPREPVPQRKRNTRILREPRIASSPSKTLGRARGPFLTAWQASTTSSLVVVVVVVPVPVGVAVLGA